MRPVKIIVVVVVVVVVLQTYLYLSDTTPAQNEVKNEEIQKKVEEEEEKKKEEEEGGGGGGGGQEGGGGGEQEGGGGGGNTKLEEENQKKEKKKEEKKKEEEGGGRGGGGGVKRSPIFWVDEMEETSLTQVDMEEMGGEITERKRTLERRCEETLGEEEKKDINSSEFLISDKYKLIWCNIFKSASSTWMYNYLLMSGKTPAQLKSLTASPVQAARQFYPRPSVDLLTSHLQGGRGERYTSFIIVREPFQRLLSAYRDKIEQDVPYYRNLRCKMTRERDANRGIFGFRRKNTCKPTFSEFVSFVLEEEKAGRSHNEHWAPYYRFCSPCVAQFDVVMKFESLHKDEVYLIEKVAGLSEVVSPKVMHSSHTNYTLLSKTYYEKLKPEQLLGLMGIYLADFRLFGYDERPYLNYVLK